MSISPIYKCPSCGDNSFVVNARLPGSYLIGVCLHCEKTGTLPESAEQIVVADVATCRRYGCKSAVYADGLCNFHFCV